MDNAVRFPINMKNLFKDSDEWKVDEKINPETLEFENTYYYNGEEAYRMHLKSKLAQNYEGYLLIERDLRNISSWLNLIKKNLHEIYGDDLPSTIQFRQAEFDDHFDMLKSLMVSVVTFYGKLFTSAEGRMVKLDTQLFKNKTDLMDLHDHLIKQRNNFTAHSGKLKVERVNLVLLMDKNRNSIQLPVIAKELFQPNSLSVGYIDEIEELIKFIKNEINNKLDNIHRKLYSNITGKGKNFWHDIFEMET